MLPRSEKSHRLIDKLEAYTKGPLKQNQKEAMNGGVRFVLDGDPADNIRLLINLFFVGLEMWAFALAAVMSNIAILNAL